MWGRQTDAHSKHRGGDVEPIVAWGSTHGSTQQSHLLDDLSQQAVNPQFLPEAGD